ncbi:MAG: acyl-CoA dehydrogenase family protein [Rhodospirillales bacterium]|nr:acyl-CoA dehydrogenase family protein [Rhodospirillales bacterium]
MTPKRRFMDFEIPDETRVLIDTVRRFVETEVQPLEDEVEELGHVPADKLNAVKAKAQALGLYAMNMPVDVGGGGLSTVETCLVEEQLGRTSDALIRRIFGQVYPMLTACEGAQRDDYLIPTVKGERICAMAITEPGAGSDAAAISTTAVPDGDDWVLHGRKHFISDGDIADYAIVMALTDREKRARGGITLFLVDKGTSGFSVGRVQHMMGQRGYGHAELVFEDCRVGSDKIMGELGEGFRLIMNTVSAVRLAHIGARSVGMASRVLELARNHANERHQFGQPIGQFQMVQQMLADMATDIFATRMMVLNTAWEIDQDREARDKVSIVKLFASEMIGRVADKGVQIFGGMGYAKEMPLERIYRDSRVLRIYDGTSEIHRMLIARSVLRNGFEP